MSERLLKIHDILGDPRHNIPPMIPISQATWYRGIQAGQFPKPVRIGNTRSSFWRESDILKLLQEKAPK